MISERKKVIQSAGTISALTMLSRLLGLIRDVLMAGFFGTSLVMSAFVVAFTIPNLFRRLFGEGALSAALVPVLVETREKEGDETAWLFVNRVFSMMAVVLTLITVLVIAATLFVGGANERIVAVASLLRIMMPYMIFICLAAVSMGILNAFHHFAVPAFAPSILNLIWIGALLLVAPFFGKTPEQQIRLIAWAILLAGFLQWAVQWPMLCRHGWRPHWSTSWRTPRIRKMLWLMAPAALGMAVTQINVMVDRLLAMWVGPQAPSALFYSERLIYFPLGLIATALGTVLLPLFSRQAARKDHAAMRRGISDSLRHLLLVMVPAAVGLAVLARPIVQMIFEWRTFSSTSTDLTTVALQCYAPGLLIFSLAKVYVPAFYALQDTRTPVRIGIWTVGLNIALNITFILTLPPGIRHAGIALGTVLAECFSVTCLARLLQRRIGPPDWRRIASTAWRVLVASAGMAGCTLLVHAGVCHLLPDADQSKWLQLVATGSALATGLLSYLLCAIGLRLDELSEILSALRRQPATSSDS